MNFHAGARYQRGRGLGSLFGGLMRGFMPLLSRGVSATKSFLSSPVGQSIKNTLADSGMSAVKNLTADLLEGKDFKTSASDQISDAKKKLASTLRGSGRKRKATKSCQKSICSAKKKITNKQYNLLDHD